MRRIQTDRVLNAIGHVGVSAGDVSSLTPLLEDENLNLVYDIGQQGYTHIVPITWAMAAAGNLNPSPFDLTIETGTTVTAGPSFDTDTHHRLHAFMVNTIQGAATAVEMFVGISEGASNRWSQHYMLTVGESVNIAWLFAPANFTAQIQITGGAVGDTVFVTGFSLQVPNGAGFPSIPFFSQVTA